MKTLIALIALIGAFTATARAQIISLENPSSGAYTDYQYFTLTLVDEEITAINWGTGQASGGFILWVEGSDILLGDFADGIYDVTETPIAYGQSVMDVEPDMVNRADQYGTSTVPQPGVYYGIRYEEAGSFYFGWVNVAYEVFGSGGIMNAIAFNTIAGEDIQAGVIPEPKAHELAILALAALSYGSFARRHRPRRA